MKRLWRWLLWVGGGILAGLAIAGRLFAGRKARELLREADALDVKAKEARDRAEAVGPELAELERKASAAKTHREEVQEHADEERKRPAGGSKSDVDSELRR